METQITDTSPTFPTFGRRKIRPCVCIVDRKRHIRTFLCNALEALEFATCECADSAEVEAVLQTQRPDLVVLGLSARGEEGEEVLSTLAARQFVGKVLLLGPRASPTVQALQDLGTQLKLEMLPALCTPFGSGNLRDSVAMLMPANVPQPPVELTEALSAGWLELWYQPKVNTRTVTVDSAEALIRMRHPTWGIVTPAYFIPDDGDPRLQAMSEFTVAQAIRDWHEFVVDSGPIEIAINLPMVLLQDPDSISRFCRKMPNHPAFEGLMVEINGLEIIRNLDQAKTAARLLRFHNVGISIDDLGAEWPSLTGINDFPFVEIKVDRKFVTGCADDHLKQALCRRILDLAQGYGARTVAEGVETIADFLAVRAMGFDLAQGFLFSRPVGAKKFARTVLLRRSGFA
jgi:EAL domain-containing protein (putative c-di-GMP-specific phosphodiesterase class I)/CheY-like chemotaxis protein